MLNMVIEEQSILHPGEPLWTHTFILDQDNILLMHRLDIMRQNQPALFSFVYKSQSCLWGSASEKKRINKQVCT